MRITISWALFFFLSLTVQAHPQDAAFESLTLEDAIKLVLERNPSLQEAADAVAIFKARVEQNRSGSLPGARADVSYSRIGPVPAFTIPDFGSFQLFPANNYDLHAGVYQLIYDGKRTEDSVNLSRSQVDTAVDRWDLLKRDLTFQTAQLFYLILYLQEDLRVQDEHVQVLNDHLLTAQKKLSAGTATELDVLNTQVRLVSAQNLRLDLENSLEKQMITLRRLSGLEEKAELKLQGDFTYQALAVEPAEMIRQALEKRLEARAIQNLMTSAQIQFRLAGRHDKPSISLNFLFGVKNGYVPDINKMKLNFAAAVQADLPIFDGHLTRALRAEATANIKTIEDRNRDLEQMIRSEVLQAVSDVEASMQKVQSAEINILQAEKALEFARVRYEAGTITNLDLLDTEEAHSEAQFVRLQALYRFVVSRLALNRAAGDDLSR
jgi:outer membrane protein